MLTEDRVLCYDPSYNNCFQSTNKFVAAKILLHRWKKKQTNRWRIPWYNHNQCWLFSYEIMRPAEYCLTICIMCEMNVNRIAMGMAVSGLLTQPGTSDLRHMRTNTHNYVPQEKSEIFKAWLRKHCFHFSWKKHIRSVVIF